MDLWGGGGGCIYIYIYWGYIGIMQKKMETAMMGRTTGFYSSGFQVFAEQVKGFMLV